MKIRKKIMTILICSLMVVSVAACGKKGSNSVVGTWKAQSDTSDITSITFDNDGKGKVSMGSSISLDITYTIENDNVKITMSFLGQTVDDTYKYSVDKDKLTLEKNGEKIELNKSK